MTALSRLAPRTLLGWLWLGAGIAVLALLGAAAWLARDQIYQSALDPGTPYPTYEPPPAPDYRDGRAWALRPDLPLAADQAAIFFIHPTTYDGGSEWNAPYDRPQEAEELESVILPNYAAPFAEAGAVYAPHYRQAALYTLMNNREDSLDARMTAYGDIRRAFDRFLSEISAERSFIIVGIGQGGQHGLGLLMEAVAPAEALRARLAAAYLIEAPIPTALFEGPLAPLAPCTAPEAVRCVIAFAPMGARERRRREDFTQRSVALTAQGRLVSTDGRDLLCVNPLSWRADEVAAPARDHLGGAAAEGLGAQAAASPLAAQTGARCEDGVLIIDRPRSASLRWPNRLAETRRVPPYNLFYMDLRADALRRVDRLGEVRAAEAEAARFAPPLEAPEEVPVAPVRPID